MRLRNKQWTAEYIKNHDNWLLHPKEEEKFDVKNFPNCELEIGCGKGNFIIQKALENPEITYIGVEKEQTVLGVALKKAVAQANLLNIEKIPNLFFIDLDAKELTKYFSSHFFQKIYLNFSDPWPKRKHKTKRLTHGNFLEKFSVILSNLGKIEVKTDNDNFFNFTISELKNNPYFKITYQTLNLYLDFPVLKNNVQTEYEKKFHDSGIAIKKIVLQKK